MGQIEVLTFLQERPGQVFSSKQLSQRLGVDKRIICASMSQLVKFKLVDVDKSDKKFKFSLRK